jgi:hypothetical protein
MEIHGIIQSAQLEEYPPGTDTIEMVLKVQGVGAGQPRRLVIPFGLLLAEPTLDPESVAGHGFEAEVHEAAPGRWEVERITVAQRRILREQS